MILIYLDLILSNTIIMLSRFITRNGIPFSLMGVGIGIFSFRDRYLKNQKPNLPQKLNLSDFNQKFYSSEDLGRYNNNVRYEYTNPENGEEVCYIDYDPTTGRVRWWVVYQDYQHKTLGKQMLNNAIADMKEHGAKKINGCSYAEEMARMQEHNDKIKRVKRSGVDYYEMDI